MTIPICRDLVAKIPQDFCVILMLHSYDALILPGTQTFCNTAHALAIENNGLFCLGGCSGDYKIKLTFNNIESTESSAVL